MFKDALQGKPFRHPLHPLLVHFPVGLFVLSLFLDLGSLAAPGVRGLVSGAFYCILLGVLTALIAAIPGFLDYSEIRRDRPGKHIATLHMVLNLFMVALYAVNLGVRASIQDEPRTPLGPLVLSLIGVGILSISGYLGGHMIYSDGIGVGRHRRRVEMPDETLRFSTSGLELDTTEHGTAFAFVPTVAIDRLHDKETLRLQVDHQVLVLVKLEGNFYAFQEFCTHRCGPLSEGSFRNEEVQCPWHGSCFDVRTGRVTRGPAKVELQVFPVQIRHEKVWIGVPRPPAAEKTEPQQKAA